VKFKENDIITRALRWLRLHLTACSPKDWQTVSSAGLPTHMCLLGGRQSIGNRMYLNCC
jgi:hypothetical protein